MPLPIQVAEGHQPWSPDRVRALSDRALIARAAEILGLPTDQLPLALRCGALPTQLAVLRTTAEVLLALLEETSAACPDCIPGTERARACAHELGTLEARLAALAHDVGLVLGWLQEAPTRG